MARPRLDLTRDDQALVRQAKADAQKAQTAYRALLRKMSKRYSQAAVARAVGVSPQALSEMLKRN